MAKILIKDVSYISRLARIELKEGDLGKYQKELSFILDFVSQLQEVNTEGVEPLTSVAGIINVTRVDKITNTPDRTELLKNAPQTKNGSIKTNKVIGA